MAKQPWLTLQLAWLHPQTVAFFARKNKLRGTACFMGGIVLVFLRYPFWGMLIEAFGFLNLFG